MSSKIKFCEKCSQTKKNMESVNKNYSDIESLIEFGKGMIIGFSDDIKRCPYCDNDLETINMSTDDFFTIRDASNCNRDLLFAMIKLHDEDPIEYELKMAQFREIAERKQPNTSNQPHCPYCNSTDITKVSGTSRFASTLMFGIGSKKVGKQWKCNNCKSYF